MKIAIIDYGVGNLGSVVRSVQLTGNGELISRPEALAGFDKAILPGVGNFSDCARDLHSSGWSDEINEHAAVRQKPFLGICVGMQLLATSSSEGGEGGQFSNGLDLIPGHVEHLRVLGCNNRTPHVGWNDVAVRGKESLFAGIDDGSDFYFVHSYSFVPKASLAIIATTSYGVDVVAAVRSNNIWGTQFHPEKSSRAGLRLLQNFINGPDA